MEHNIVSASVHLNIYVLQAIKWSRDVYDPNTLRVQCLEFDSKPDRFRDSVPKDHRMACGLSNSHVTDDVT